jgi:hypothetical protein
MNAADKREQRLKLVEEHIGEAVRLEKLRTRGTV